MTSIRRPELVDAAWQLTPEELRAAIDTLGDVAARRGLIDDDSGGFAGRARQANGSYPEISDRRVASAYAGYKATIENLGSIGITDGELRVAEPEVFQTAFKEWHTPDMTAYKTALRNKHKLGGRKKYPGLDYTLIAIPNVTVSAQGILALMTAIGTNHAKGTRIVADENMQVLLKLYPDQEVSGTSPWDEQPAIFTFVPSRYVGKFGNLRKQRQAKANMRRKPVVPLSMLGIATYLETLALRQPNGKLESSEARGLTKFYLTDMGTQQLGNDEFIPSVSVINDGTLVVNHTSAHKSMTQRPAVGKRPPKQHRVYLDRYRNLGNRVFEELTDRDNWRAVLDSFAGPSGPGPTHNY